MRRGLLFKQDKNRYLMATCEAVAHRVLGRYLGLRQLPAFPGRSPYFGSQRIGGWGGGDSLARVPFTEGGLCWINNGG